MKYAKIKNDLILHVVDVPFELNLLDHVLVDDEVEREPGFYHVKNGKVIKKPQKQIDAILVKRNKKNRSLEERVLQLEARILQLENRSI